MLCVILVVLVVVGINASQGDVFVVSPGAIQAGSFLVGMVVLGFGGC